MPDDDGTIAGHDRLEDLLAAHLPPRELAAAMRLLHGGTPAELELPPQSRALAGGGGGEDGNAEPANGTTPTTTAPFELRAYSLAGNAKREQGRAPRVVRLGLIQHASPLPTTAPYAAQRDAAFARVERLATAAGEARCNVLCLQEAWTMPFAFCTREREWCEFAEPADETGPATRLCRELARRFSMVVVSPILERDAAHGDTIWNTCVVIGPDGNVIGKHRKVSVCVRSSCDRARARVCRPPALKQRRAHTPNTHKKTPQTNTTRRTTSPASATSTSPPTTPRATRATRSSPPLSGVSPSTSATAATTRSTGSPLVSTAPRSSSTRAPRSGGCRSPYGRSRRATRPSPTLISSRRSTASAPRRFPTPLLRATESPRTATLGTFTGRRTSQALMGRVRRGCRGGATVYYWRTST